MNIVFFHQRLLPPNTHPASGQPRRRALLRHAGALLLWSGAAFAALLPAGNLQAGLFKADPAKPSPFLEHPRLMRADSRIPFARVWENPDPAAWQRIRSFQKIAIAPVNTRYVRGSSRLSRGDVQSMAAYMRETFRRDFVPYSGLRPAVRPGPRTLVLELALVELRPSHVPGNVLCTGASVFVPGVTLVGGRFTHGAIAFEAKLRNGETGELLAEYADRRYDKVTFFSFRDYAPYAHDRRTVQDWALEMRCATLSPVGQRVHRAMWVSLNPF